MRDGLGMVGGLTFSYFTSSLFDSYVKEFRLFADIINDVGLTLDMLAPHTQHVLYITTSATLCKIMCGITAGATKGSITQHFCKRGNMADLNAKEGTQETLVSLIGMILGVVLARHLNSVEQDEQRGPSQAAAISWSIFSVLTIVHVWINYVGVKLLHLKTLNQERAKVTLKGVIDAVTEQSQSNLDRDEWVEKAIEAIPSPAEVSESLLASTLSMFFSGKVRLGATFRETVRGVSTIEVLKQLKDDEKYLLAISRGVVKCTLFAGASDKDELKAFIQVLSIRRCMQRGMTSELALER